MGTSFTIRSAEIDQNIVSIEITAEYEEFGI
jgi:hypothetical protein